MEKIFSAAHKNLSNINSSLPNMANTITSWFLDITLYKVERQLDGADWKDGQGKAIKVRGVIQPPRDTELNILPEGTWDWDWLMLHCLPNVDIEPNQFYFYDGKKYKIMSKKNFNKYGYIRYMLLEAWRTT